MTEAKRHHYIPQMFQRRFTNTSGNLYFFYKGEHGRGVQETSPNNLFVKNNLHTIIEHGGARNLKLETFYSAMEDRANEIIEKIVTAARDGKLPHLTDNEKLEWDNFVFFQWKRVPDVHNSIYGEFDRYLESILKEYLESILKDFELERRPFTAKERALFDDSKWIAQLRQNMRVETMGRPSKEANRVLNGRGLGIVVINRQNKSFVLGSSPIVKLTHPGVTNLADPSVELWLPIASDIAVSPDGRRGEEKVVAIPDYRHLRSLNEIIFMQSSIIAGCSRALISSISGCR